MEENGKLNVGVGDKEPEKLEAKDVLVQGVKIEKVFNKEKTKEIGEKAVFIVKHDDREEPLEISKTAFIKGKSVTFSGTWFNLDVDNKVVKNSALANTMVFYSVSTLNEIVGKKIQTVLDDGYLSIKAY